MNCEKYLEHAYSKSKEERTRFLIEYRNASGMTNQQLAERLHTSRRTVEGWINRKQAPAAVTALLAEILELSEIAVNAIKQDRTEP